MISIVIPVLDDARALEVTLASVPDDAEVIVVDGGSSDDSVQTAARMNAIVVHSERGRARQMNTGAAATTGDVLVFLHADTRLPRRFDQVMQRFASSSNLWGRFDVRLSGRQPTFRMIAFMMNWRSRLTGICTGDQALFVKASAFEGFPDIPLMEDIAFSRQMRRRRWPWCPRERVITSSRRWEERGIWPTILLMWRLRLAYFFGASPETLVGRYR